MTSEFEKDVERVVGITVDELRAMSPTDYRELLERGNGKKLKFTSEFPFIGRGNVLRDGLIDHNSLNNEVDRIIDKCLKQKSTNSIMTMLRSSIAKSKRA